jgi:hypothetical protein
MTTIETYNEAQSEQDKAICDILTAAIDTLLPYTERKIWHSHPVWFIEGNPIVGYSKQKKGIRLMFWSGASFDENTLQQGTGKFKDASIFYTEGSQIVADDLRRWLEKSVQIQWDYKNIVKRKGKLERLG